MMDINEVTVARWFSDLDAARVLIAVTKDDVIAVDLDRQTDPHPSAFTLNDAQQILADLGIGAGDVTQCRLVTRIGPGGRR